MRCLASASACRPCAAAGSSIRAGVAACAPAPVAGLARRGFTPPRCISARLAHAQSAAVPPCCISRRPARSRSGGVVLSALGPLSLERLAVCGVVAPPARRSRRPRAVVARVGCAASRCVRLCPRLTVVHAAAVHRRSCPGVPAGLLAATGRLHIVEQAFALARRAAACSHIHTRYFACRRTQSLSQTWWPTDSP